MSIFKRNKEPEFEIPDIDFKKIKSKIKDRKKTAEELLSEIKDAINEHNMRKKPYEALLYKCFKYLIESEIDAMNDALEILK